jgi:Tol biopolymer transport system component
MQTLPSAFRRHRPAPGPRRRSARRATTTAAKRSYASQDLLEHATAPIPADEGGGAPVGIEHNPGVALPPGAQLGPYRIVDKVGEGGMGEVYRAHDARLHRDVAVKILPPAFASNPERLRRFEQEARAAAALNHPNVLAVFDVHIQGDPPYVVSELLEGASLRERLMSGPLPPRTAVDIATQIARGLAAAHHKGIVHRDLKPANVFICTDGRAKILDFGLARVAEPRDADDVVTMSGGGPSTGVGAVLGTVGYMSPEQARGDAADTRSDIFALGVVCYEMLAGRRAFGGASEIEVLSAILRDDPPNLPDGAVPEALERIVRRCLEKQPAQRFQSAADVAFALEALSGTSASSRPADRVPAAVASPAATPKGRPALALVAAAVGGAAIAAAATAWRLAPDPPPAVAYDARTFDRRPVMNARFMPDGQTIVYSAATQGAAPELFVVSPTAEAPQRLGVTDAHLLSVSSSGELALVVNARHQQQRLYAGTFARMTIGSAPRAIRHDVREADWQPNGDAMAIVQDLGTGRDRLEYPMGTTLHEANGYLSDPRVSPDGTQVAFVAHPWRFDDRGTVMVAGRNAAAKALTGELWSVEGLAWSPDGARLVFSGNTSGGSSMEPMSVPADGSAPARTVLGVPGRLIVHDIARDGRWLAVREDLTFGVRARVPGSDEERELSWLGTSGARSLSADGRQLLMVDVGRRSGADYGVVLRGTDGADGVRLGTGSAQRLSPDGRWAAAIIAMPSEIVLYPTGAGEPVRLGRGRFAEIESVDWFPDNRRLLVCGAQASSAPRCFVQPLDDTAPTPATAEGVMASVGPDGTTLLLTAPDGTMAVSSLGARDSRPIAALARGDRVVGWSADSRAVFVQREATVPASVDRVELATGVRTTAATLKPEGLGGLASLLVADWVDGGRWYAYNYTSAPSVLYVVTGARP